MKGHINFIVNSDENTGRTSMRVAGNMTYSEPGPEKVMLVKGLIESLDMDTTEMCMLMLSLLTNNWPDGEPMNNAPESGDFLEMLNKCVDDMLSEFFDKESDVK